MSIQDAQFHRHGGKPQEVFDVMSVHVLRQVWLDYAVQRQMRGLDEEEVMVFGQHAVGEAVFHDVLGNDHVHDGVARGAGSANLVAGYELAILADADVPGLGLPG
jgi:hypothetical protein